jgi:hypothetical protein
MYSGGTPSVGVRVFTADGDELGKVKEISGSCFKVDAPMQPDYWLGTDSIASASGDGVRLSFSKEDLGDEKRKGPEHKGMHDHR